MGCWEWYLDIRGEQKNCLLFIFPCLWVLVTTAWRVLRLRMEEWSPIWRVAANKLNKQSRTADKGWSSSLGVGRGANTSFPWKKKVLKYSWARCFLWGQNKPEVKHSPTRISGGGVFLEEASRNRKGKRDIMLGTWNPSIHPSSPWPGCYNH